MRTQTKKLVYGAVLAAMAVILTYIIRFPIFPAMSFLEYDMGDVPLFVGAVTLGPWIGLSITAVSCVIQGFTVSAQSGIIGIIMHFMATGAFVLCAGFMTRRKKDLKSIIPAFICGAITQILIMIPLNLIFTSAFGLQGGSLIKAVSEAAKLTGKAVFTFPHNAKAVLCGIAFAAAFVVAFAVSLVYTVDRKSDTGKKLAFGIKGTVIGILSGIFYGLLVLLTMNLLYGDVELTEGMAFVRSMLFTYCVPFNAIKAVGNAVIAYLLYAIVGRRIKIAD